MSIIFQGIPTTLSTYTRITVRTQPVRTYNVRTCIAHNHNFAVMRFFFLHRRPLPYEQDNEALHPDPQSDI